MARAKNQTKVTSSSEALRTLAAGLRHAAIRPNINGYKPHEKQCEFHCSPAKIRAFLGGNRSGKTVAGATEAVMYLTGKHKYRKVPPPPYVQGRIVGADFINSIDKELKPQIARWMPPSELLGGHWDLAYNKETHTLSLENGNFVEFMSTEQDLDKHASVSRTFVWFDEEMPYDYYNENKMRLIDQGGDLWMTLTPLEGMSGWIYDEIYVASMTSEFIHCVTVEMDDNPHINAVEAEAMLSGLDADELQARKQGRFIQIGGLIYKNFSEKNIIDPFLPPQEWLHAASLDHGFNNPTAWLWVAVDKDGRVFVYDEHYESGKVVSYHAQEVHKKNAEHCQQAKGNLIPAYYVGDPSIRNRDPITGTSIQLEYIEHGIPIILGNNDVAAGINRVSRYIQDHENNRKLYITRNCVNLIHELGRYRWAVWANKKIQRDRDKKEEPHKKEDHAADSLRYFIMSRPDWDTGTEIPEKNSHGLPEPIMDVNNVIDKGVLTPSRPTNLDYHMGDEF